jgi:hypothetical protein
MFEHLDEKQRRLLAGGVARLLGRGGPTRVAEASGMSRNTVNQRGYRTVTVLGDRSGLAIIPTPPRVARAVEIGRR